MIVQQIADRDQIVLQTDHDDLSGALAAAWGNDGFWAPSPRESVVLACASHDAGWSKWESEPAIDPDSHRPQNFLDVEIPLHLSMFRQGVSDLAGKDPYSGALVSMHATGIYRQRHGTQPALGLTRRSPDVEDRVDSFVAEQDEWRREVLNGLDANEGEFWSAYRLLQVADRFSLLAAFTPEINASLEINSAPGADGEDVPIRITRSATWQFTIDPYPLREPKVELEMVRRVMPHQRWETQADFFQAFLAAEPEHVVITVTGAPVTA